MHFQGSEFSVLLEFIYFFSCWPIGYWPVISCLPCFSPFLASAPLCSWTHYRTIGPRRWSVHPERAITVNKHYCRLSDNMLPNDNSPSQQACWPSACRRLAKDTSAPCAFISKLYSTSGAARKITTQKRNGKEGSTPREYRNENKRDQGKCLEKRTQNKT